VCGRVDSFDSAPSDFTSFTRNQCASVVSPSSAFRQLQLYIYYILLYSTTTTYATTVNYCKTTTTVTSTGDDDASQLEIAGNALKGFYPTFHNRFSRNTCYAPFSQPAQHMYTRASIYLIYLYVCIVYYTI